jgi:hypothetical protein
MYQGKYAKYLTTNIKEDTIMPDEIPGPTFGFQGASQMPEAKANFGWNVIYKPYFIDRVTHVHAGDEYLCFLAGNVPDCFSEFDAEAEIYLGKEQEKYVITQPTIVFIPKGLLHCPLEFKKVNKPLLFVMILLTPSFALTTIDGKKVDMANHPPTKEDVDKLRFPGGLGGKN